MNTPKLTQIRYSLPLLDKGHFILQQLLILLGCDLMEFINQRTGIIKFGKLKACVFSRDEKTAQGFLEFINQ